MNIKYFSWVRDQIGIEEEMIELDPKVNSVKDLISKLIKNSEKHSKALSDTSLIRCAVNMEIVNLDHKINNDDEITVKNDGKNLKLLSKLGIYFFIFLLSKLKLTSFKFILEFIFKLTTFLIILLSIFKFDILSV